MTKDKVLRFPFRIIFGLFCAVGADRSRGANVADQVAQHFADNEEFRLLIAPEGMRSKR